MVQRVLWQIGQHLCSGSPLVRCNQTPTQQAAIFGAGGDHAIRAIADYEGSTDKVANAILQQGVFSTQYIRKSLKAKDSIALRL